MTDDEASITRLLDRGDDWKVCDADDWLGVDADPFRQALHDRDRFQRDAEYWREECIKLTGEALA